MTTRTDALHLLTIELDRRARAPEGRRALRRFAAHGVDVGTATFISDLVAACHDGRRSSSGTAASLLDRLLALAPSDTDAALCALVALRPALYRIARRVSSPMPVDDDAIAEVVSIAWAVVAAASSSSVSHRRVIAATWTQSRTTLRRRAEHVLREAELPVGWDMPAPPEVLSGDVDQLLARAVVKGTLAPEDAELIALTRDGAVTLDELAARRGVVRSTLLRRRNRAEATLRATVRADRRSR